MMSDSKPTVLVQRLPSTMDAPRAARDSAVELLHRLGAGAERADDLRLAVSELVTNAVVHGADTVLEMRLHATPRMMRVEVSDNGTKAFQWPADGSKGHRGLDLVRTFSERCGILRAPSTLVWCEFDLA
jgi:anti-sigma regulatory factor (Ser/Thr protein kinase)